MKNCPRPQTNLQSLISNIQYLLAPLILFAPVLFTGKALFWGTPSLQFIPWWDYALDTLRAGHLPLWNPLVGMGAPLLANYQSALFYPPNWIYLLLGLLGGTPLMAWGMAWLVALHLMWAGLGMAALTRKLGLGRLSQTVAGLAFSLSGYLVARAGFLSINSAAAWLPWVLLFSFVLVEPYKTNDIQGVAFKIRRVWVLRKTLWNMIRLGGVIGLQLLAGHAQTTWYTLVLAMTWITFWAWVNSNAYGLPSRLWNILRGWARYAGAGLIGLGLAAVQLFPTAEYLLQSQRSAAVDYEFAMTYSFWPWRFLTLLAPNMFGNPAHGNYWGYATYWEDAVYIGLLPLLLALTALYTLRKGTQHVSRITFHASRFTFHVSFLTVYCLLITVFSFLLALGKNTPIFPWLYRHIPTFDMFQAPTRITLWATFALALLAGLGVEQWRRPQKRALYWTRLGTAGAFAISLGAGLAWYFMDDVRLTFIHASALAGFWALGTGALALTAPPRGEDSDGVSLRAELAERGNPLHGQGDCHVTKDAPRSDINGVSLRAELAERGNPLHGQGDCHVTKDAPRSDINGVSLRTERSGVRQSPRWSGRLPRHKKRSSQRQWWHWGVALWVAADLIVAGWGLNPSLPLDFYRQRMETSEVLEVQTSEVWGRIYLPPGDEDELKFERFLLFEDFSPPVDWDDMRAVHLPNLNMLDNVPMVNNFDPFVPGRYQRWMETLGEVEAAPWAEMLNLMGVTTIERVSSARDVGVALTPWGDNRGVRWVGCAHYVGDGEGALDAIAEGEVDLAAWITLEGQRPPGPLACSAGEGSARHGARPSPNRVVLHVEANQPGWVLWSEVWYPGWRAWVDGQPVAVERGDYLFQAIPVPAGEHEVVLAYHPAWFYAGVCVSAATLGAVSFFLRKKN